MIDNKIIPRIYVACLAAYNNGILHGRWINAHQRAEAISQDIQHMLAESPIPHSEEWAIHDYEGFGGIRLSESEPIESVVQIAAFIEVQGELGIDLILCYGDVACAQHALESHYYGEYESELDFATDLFGACYADSIPDSLKYYIDYKAFQRDIFINDFLSLNVGTKVHVFCYRSCE